MFKVVSKSNKKVILKYFREIGEGEGRVFDQFFSEFDGKYDEIDILMHCYGGIVFEGNLMYNILKAAKSIVNIDVVGVAASQGAILLKAVRGTKANPKGKVRIARNGFVMIHRVRGGAVGNADDMVQVAKLMNDMEKTFTEDLADSTGLTEAEVYDKWFKDGADHWLNAEEACNVYHLVDEIMDPIVKDITKIDTTMAAQLGEKAMFGKFAAYLEDKEPPSNNTNSNLNDNKEMKKEELIARYKLTGVTAESSDTAIMEAIDAQLKAESDKAEKAANELKAIKDKEITDLVDAAATEGKIKAKEGQTLDQVKATFVKIGKSAGLEALKAALENAQPHKTIVSQLPSGGSTPTGTGGDANKDNWTWDEWQKQAVENKAVAEELDKMPNADPDKFKALYKGKYGKEPAI